MNASDKEFGDIETDVMALLTFTQTMTPTMTTTTTTTSTDPIHNETNSLTTTQHWEPPEPYQKEPEEEKEEEEEVNVNDKAPPMNSKTKKKKRKRGSSSKKRPRSSNPLSSHHEPNPYQEEPNQYHQRKRFKIELFTFDVCKVGKNGVRPGRMVFLTKERVFNAEVRAIQWRVEDLTSKERLRPKRSNSQNEVPEDNVYTWYEKECNLIKECA